MAARIQVEAPEQMLSDIERLIESGRYKSVDDIASKALRFLFLRDDARDASRQKIGEGLDETGQNEGSSPDGV